MEEKARNRKIERNLFQLGVLLLIGQAISLLVVAALRPALFGKTVALITSIIVGGHLGSIPAGLAMGFRPGMLICLLSFFNLMWLLLFYSLVIKLSDRAVGRNLVGRIVQDTHRIATRQERRIRRFGTLGLAVFVWLPFPWTGSLVGAVIGLLMGLSTPRIMLVVVPSMLVAITSWTLGFAHLFHLMAQLEKGVAAGLVACIVLLALLIRFHHAHQREDDQN